jgi:hypothetical protein
MDPIEIREKKRAAQRRLRAQRAKAGELRGRVVAISLICFVLLWGIVFVQMATGNDPVLGDSSSRVAKGGGHRHRARPRVESDASTNSGEPEASEASEPEVEQFSEEPVEEEPVEPEEEFSEEVEVEPVEEEFVEEEPAPVTTSQS